MTKDRQNQLWEEELQMVQNRKEMLINRNSRYERPEFKALIQNKAVYEQMELESFEIYDSANNMDQMNRDPRALKKFKPDLL